MRVVAGDRAVHIHMSYEDANKIVKAGVTSGWRIIMDLAKELKPALEHGKKHGYPLPPLPKSNVAHNSDVEIVEKQLQCSMPDCDLMVPVPPNAISVTCAQHSMGGVPSGVVTNDP